MTFILFFINVSWCTYIFMKGVFMKGKEFKIVSYYSKTDKSLNEILYQYFKVYVKNKICFVWGENE